MMRVHLLKIVLAIILLLEKIIFRHPLHIWEDGGHGYGLAKGRGTIEAWTKIVKEWMVLYRCN